MRVRNATLSSPAGLVSYPLVNYSETCHSKLRQISSKMCISVSNRTERKGTPVDRNVLICSFVQFFPQNSRVVLVGWLRKGYVQFLVWMSVSITTWNFKHRLCIKHFCLRRPGLVLRYLHS